MHNDTIPAGWRTVAFVPTVDGERSKTFYENVLGLRFVADDGFALMFEAGGTTVRVARVDALQPARYTILGWEVPDIAATMSDLTGRGVQFENFGLPGQAETGVWAAPGGARVAWFKDPDGNLLSITQSGA